MRQPRPSTLPEILQLIYGGDGFNPSRGAPGTRPLTEPALYWLVIEMLAGNACVLSRAAPRALHIAMTQDIGQFIARQLDQASVKRLFPPVCPLAGWLDLSFRGLGTCDVQTGHRCGQSPTAILASVSPERAVIIQTPHSACTSRRGQLRVIRKLRRTKEIIYFLIILDPFAHCPVEKTLQKSYFLIWHLAE